MVNLSLKKTILNCSLYARNDDELIAPPPKDPVRLLFCTLVYAWNDYVLIAQGPGSAFILHPYLLGMMMD